MLCETAIGGRFSRGGIVARENGLRQDSEGMLQWKTLTAHPITLSSD